MADPIHLQPGPEAHALEDGALFFVGNATAFIRFGGFSLLTDPNFLHQGERVHLGYGLHATRRTEPASQLEDLPPWDFVLLSHLHEDHFDRKVERQLPRDTRIVTTRKAARTLARRGFQRPVGMRPWESVELIREPCRLRITSMPGRHGPMLVHRALPPVMGSMLEFGHRDHGLLLRMYVSGDTMPFSALREIPQRFAGIDVALIHLGGTRVLGVVVTMDGARGRQLVQMLEPSVVVPIHYDDYDVFRSPLSDFAREMEEAGLADRVRWIARGDTLALPNPAARALMEQPAPM